MSYGMKGGDANRQYPKKPGKNRFAHTTNSPYGMGDHYGTGIRSKIGKMREGMGFQEVSKQKLKNPTKNLA